MIRERRVLARTDKGTPYAYWTRDMPPIPAQFLDSVAFLYPDRDAAGARKAYGGSGFVASVPIYGEHPGALYIVTNQHVARKATAACLTTHNGEIETFDTPRGGWEDHPDGDDVSVFPLELGGAASRFPAIDWNSFVQADDQVTPGDDIFFLGRFIAPDGETQLDAPTARFGHLALKGTTKLRQKKRQINQESFVVEALSLPGYSGSPVMVFRLRVVEGTIGGGGKVAMTGPPTPQFEAGGIPALLGVDWGHIPSQVNVLGPDDKPAPGGLHVVHHRGFSGVVPAWKVTEILQMEKLVERREAQEEEVRNEPGLELDSSEPPRGSEEFEQFEALTRRVVNVPKSEIDDKRRDGEGQ